MIIWTEIDVTDNASGILKAKSSIASEHNDFVPLFRILKQVLNAERFPKCFAVSALD
jgi:hypothetical protein